MDGRATAHGCRHSHALGWRSAIAPLRRFASPQASNRLGAFVAFVLASANFGLAQSSDAIQPATIVSAREVNDAIELTVLASGFDARHDRLLLADRAIPLGWADALHAADAPNQFVARLRPVTDVVPAGADTLRAWRVRADLIATLVRSWPAGAPLLASVESVGPGAQSVWISAGGRAGILPGQSWWRRVNGQPMLRFEVRFVAADVCYCRVAPLAGGVLPNVGDAVALWPGPGEQREGRLTSAVSLVDTTQADPLVWIPMPPRAAVPREPRFDFFRAGQYVGHGVAERSSDAFCYARVLAPACSGPIRVGDDAVPRTLADIAAGRVTGRVFAQSSEGWLVTAGESDGIKLFQQATLVRGGAVFGLVEVRRVQNAYCTITGVLPPGGAVPGTASGEKDSVQLLDEVRFGRPTGTSKRVGVIESILPNGAFSAHTTIANAPVGQAVAIELGGATVGAAVLVTASEQSAIGFALVESLLLPLAPGMELVTPTPVASPR
jgi:hypothetical protein